MSKKPTKLSCHTLSQSHRIVTKSHDPVITWLGDHLASEKRYISTFTRPMATKVEVET